MSSKRRLVTLYYDVSSNILRNSSGSELKISHFPFITFREKIIINLHLVTASSLTVYDRLDATMVLEAAIDNQFQSSQLMCKTLNSGINQSGDWEDGSDADITAGEISIKMSGDTTGFQSKMGTKSSLSNTKFELKTFDDSNNLFGRYEFPFLTNGLISDGDSIPNQETENFQWFTDDSGAKCLRIVNDDGEVLQILHPAGV